MIPIVFAAVTDPVVHGLVESLARPGGNVTGFYYRQKGIAIPRAALEATRLKHRARSAKALPMPVSSANKVALAMGQTVAPPNFRRRQAVTKVIGALCLGAAIVISVPTWNESARAQATNGPRSITIGTASPGGPYAAYGEGLARILSRTLQIEVVAQITQGPAQNIVLMERKEAMLGFVTMGVALQGWNGTDWAKGTRYRSMRVIFPMYDTAFQFATLKRFAIKSLDDFAGLRIGVGPRAGTGGTYVAEIFKILGIAADIRFGAVEQMAAQMADGRLDGVVLATGFPIPALAELDSKQAIDFLHPSSEQSSIVRNKLPEITPSLIPAGTYRSRAQDYHTIGLYNFAVAHKELPDDLIYKIVKAVFHNRDELMKAQSSAKETIPVNIDRNTMLPLHPGAVRYYREIGISIPPAATVGN
jgi:TRAP transporter TAXI family solute receptor